MLGLFGRLASLFQSKCKAQGLYIHEQNGEYSTAFKLWCWKFEEAGITAEDMAKGVKHLEEHVRDSVRTENEVWPPSYMEMIGHCVAQREREEYRQWFGLPKTKLKPEEQKSKLAELRKKIKL